MLFGFDDYRGYLRQELLERIKRNSKYSLRAFARSIDLNHSSLSQILSGKKNLSDLRAYSVAKKLSLNPTESEYFVHLVRLNSSQDPSYKQKLQEEIEVRFKGKVLKTFDLSIDQFEMVSEWHHFAILQLLRIPHLHVTPELAAKRLSLHLIESKSAFERLERLGLIHRSVQNGKSTFSRIESPVLFRAENNFQALKKLNQSVIMLAHQAIEDQPSTERVAATEAIALSKEGLIEARALLYEYLDRLESISAKNRDSAKVYLFSVHGFSVDKKQMLTKGKNK